MLYLPLLIIIPVGVIGYIGYESIIYFLSKENKIIENYVWCIFLIAIAMAYFEIYYAWVKVQMKSAFGNFMKEVFHRVLILLLLFGVYFEWLTAEQFIWSLVFVYFSRLLFMKLYAVKLKFPTLIFRFLKTRFLF